ncbi:MAG TPA: YkgJ family cysteine cluster protein [Candidatus Acidoferrum sp.]|nr:YkgJ family cysteine cluster protein [Candidatus Acidoferrum sp.]
MKNSAETQRAITSRIEAGAKAVLQAKRPGQQGEQIAVNAEYLRSIRALSEGSEIENHDFRAWLKNYAPDDIDDLVKALSQKYFALIDCKECANCCRVLELEFTEPELHTIATSMEQSIDEFKKRFVAEGVMKPCPALMGNLCSIYERRPEACRTYPHFEKPDFIFRLYGVLDSIGICPIAFNAFEELKAKVKWSK